MRLDKPINQIDSIVGIPIFSTKREEDTEQESITPNEVIEEKMKKENLKQLKLRIGGD